MKKILIQFDTDSLPSSFDRVVAIDSGVDELFSYGGVTPENIEPLIHGAIFTRSAEELSNTAIFISGSNVEAGERLLSKIQDTFFGPMRVSVMIDSNGSNTTAAAAVRCASKHLDFNTTEALILGGTGPVGHRCGQILAAQGATVRIASRSEERAQVTCAEIRHVVPEAKVVPCEFSDEGVAAAVDGINLIIAAGAAGVQFLTGEEVEGIETLKVAIDVNAVPPVGLEGISPTDDAAEVNGATSYGAFGVGGLKMKTHRAAIEKLFTTNDQILNAAEIYNIAGSV
ncbi:NADP-dependent methylenetetrahydromethanopterin/methylenetetrahydrofolate dehydrogenase [Thalassoglobus polymorphus]|uniref:Bifunctional protein MdtA n=1 Tax=Thalassoglobus polymorphus TaxID=2527994 RepID=A0A517QU15_9PLAN|nr:NADP-dependent methylenetetrahydromethanopterin/methylenetetrahydrofolate dehydrogenase [Thalassoglobus polymorphus]QDT35068.1 Bifunctional protein MdtA [Thalassoglobus polymorphus]